MSQLKLVFSINPKLAFHRLFHQNHHFDHLPGIKIRRGAWAPKGEENKKNKSLIDNSHPANPKHSLYPTHMLGIGSENKIIVKNCSRNCCG